MDLSDKFEQDYSEVTYLNGSIQGNYGNSVKRKTDISTTIVTEDTDLIRVLSRLCDHSGPAHIRTKDGSNYWAKIDVQRNMDAGTGHKITKFSFNLQRHEPREYDGVLLEDWK